MGVKNNDELIGNGRRSDAKISGEKRQPRCRDVMPYNIIYSSSVAGTAVRGMSKTAKELWMNSKSKRKKERERATKVEVKSAVNRRQRYTLVKQLTRKLVVSPTFSLISPSVVFMYPIFLAIKIDETR